MDAGQQFYIIAPEPYNGVVTVGRTAGPMPVADPRLKLYFHNDIDAHILAFAFEAKWADRRLADVWWRLSESELAETVKIFTEHAVARANK